jgi:thioredoxin reductase
MSGAEARHGGEVPEYDVAIVGAGPAGLSAALLLGRCCRRVLVCDEGRPRNASSPGVYGFLSRDGVAPAELRRLGRAELGRYPQVDVRDVVVAGAAKLDGGFALQLPDGERAHARKLLLATGVVDELPPVAGLAELWGKTAFPCPYCDAWEFRGRTLGVLGHGPAALSLCRALTAWSRDLVLLSNGPSRLAPDDKRALITMGVRVVPERVLAFEGRDGKVYAAVLADAPAVTLDALFVSGAQHQRSPLVEQLQGDEALRGPGATGPHESTEVPGLYIAGDASEGVQLAIIAAAEGAQAAFAINRELVREEFELAKAVSAAGETPAPPPPVA